MITINWPSFFLGFMIGFTIGSIVFTYIYKKMIFAETDKIKDLGHHWKRK